MASVPQNQASCECSLKAVASAAEAERAARSEALYVERQACACTGRNVETFSNWSCVTVAAALWRGGGVRVETKDGADQPGWGPLSMSGGKLSSVKRLGQERGWAVSAGHGEGGGRGVSSERHGPAVTRTDTPP